MVRRMRRLDTRRQRAASAMGAALVFVVACVAGAASVAQAADPVPAIELLHDGSLSDYAQAFSEDGSKIAWVEEQPRIVVHDIASSDELTVNLDPYRFSSTGMAFSPDGSSLLVVAPPRVQGDGCSFLWMDTTTGAFEPLEPDHHFVDCGSAGGVVFLPGDPSRSSPRWAVAKVSDGGVGGYYLIDLAAGSYAKILDFKDFGVSFSFPENSRTGIGTVRRDSGPAAASSVVIVHADGSPPTELNAVIDGFRIGTNGTDQPRWSPDGTKVALMAYEETGSRAAIVFLDVTTGAVLGKIVRGDSFYGAFNADSSEFAFWSACPPDNLANPCEPNDAVWLASLDGSTIGRVSPAGMVLGQGGWVSRVGNGFATLGSTESGAFPHLWSFEGDGTGFQRVLSDALEPRTLAGAGATAVGEHIVFTGWDQVTSASGRASAWSVRRDGSDFRQIIPPQDDFRSVRMIGGISSDANRLTGLLEVFLDPANPNAGFGYKIFKATSGAPPPPPPPEAFKYVALGDSFSSGEGVEPFFEPASNRCHRSRLAYSTLVELPGLSGSSIYQLSRSGFPGMKWGFQACSGATTDDVLTTGQWRDPLPQLAPDRSADTRNPNDLPVDAGTDLVTITIGGNNMEFVEVLKFCFLSSNCTTQNFRGQPLAQFASEKRAELSPKLDAVIAQIHAQAPGARILVLGYPHLFPAFPAEQSCGKLIQVPFFKKTLRWSHAEQNYFRQATSEVNQLIAARVEASGVATFVPVDGRFAGHEICGNSFEWINAPTPAVSWRPINSQSFHPNELGHELGYAEAVNDVLNP